MDLRRLRAGEWLAAASGVALLASLFLPWYRPVLCVMPYAEALRDGGCDSLTGWESLTALDVLLAFVAACGVLVAIVTATQSVPAVPVALSALVSLVGAIGFVVLLIRALDLPSWAVEREWALWLGLASTVGIVAGALLAMREEIRPDAPRVEIEPIPAPRP